MSVDVREVLLGSLQKDLVTQFDIVEIARRRQMTWGPPRLYSVHALDAALARGATLQDAADALKGEFERVFSASAPPRMPANEAELRDALIAALDELAYHVAQTGDFAVGTAYWARLAERGLDGRTSEIDVFEDRELREVYLAGMATVTGSNAGLTPPRDSTCAVCQQPRTAAGHDACIADLPGVIAACCGHSEREPFVTMARPDGPATEDEFWRLVANGGDPAALRGETLQGNEALRKMHELGGSPPNSERRSSRRVPRAE
jgi:hypothetical protein